MTATLLGALATVALFGLVALTAAAAVYLLQGRLWPFMPSFIASGRSAEPSPTLTANGRS